MKRYNVTTREIWHVTREIIAEERQRQLELFGRPRSKARKNTSRRVRTLQHNRRNPKLYENPGIDTNAKTARVWKRICNSHFLLSTKQRQRRDQHLPAQARVAVRRVFLCLVVGWCSVMEARINKTKFCKRPTRLSFTIKEGVGRVY